ncbi:MAG: Xaa-Pro peptidase family protein [Ardenticatenia bacterium]|nr:Xaa-Pro peptidase family protein [Ardenticatenia bacterium]
MSAPVRLEQVQDALLNTELDAVALMPGPNLVYAGGVRLHRSERLNVLVIPRQGTPRALCPRLEAAAYRHLDVPLHTWSDEEGPMPALEQLVAEAGLARAVWGVEYHNAYYGEVMALRQAAPHAQFRPAEAVLTRLRLIKDETEIEALREAARVTGQIVQETLDALRPGLTERAVASHIQSLLLARGSDGAAFSPLVASGPNAADPHALPGDRVLSSGDVIIVDLGATVRGYHGDITRCAALRPVASEIRRIYDVVRRAAEAGRAAVRPGARAGEVDRAARRVIDEAGYGAYFIHRTGHGLGLQVHEPPYIHAENDETLEPGMVFTVEPGIYLPGLGGVRVEDVVVVNERGHEVLTHVSRDLVVV